VPLYKHVRKEMLIEYDNAFSMFASFLGAGIQQKTAGLPTKVNSGLQMDCTNIIAQPHGLNQGENAELDIRDNATSRTAL